MKFKRIATFVVLASLLISPIKAFAKFDLNNELALDGFETQSVITRHGGWLDSITMVMENPQDAITDLNAGTIDIYGGALAGSQVLADIQNAGLNYSESRNYYYDLTFNPAGPVFSGTGKLNPFASPKIRQAVNWLVDRSYIAQTIYGDTAVPKFLPIVTGFPDYERYKDIVTTIEEQYAYDLSRANTAISTEMMTWGATLVGGTWQHNGEPVTLIFIIRNDGDGTRVPLGNYVADQLESIGFNVDRQYKTSSEASPIWLQSDPEDGLWHLYTGGWVTVSVSRDDGSNFQFFYTPQGWEQPLWQEYTPSAEFSQVADDLATLNFSSLNERRTLFKSAFNLALQDSVRVWLVDTNTFSTWRDPFDVSIPIVGVIQFERLWPYTFKDSSQIGGTAIWGNADLLVDPPNPVAGSNWSYDRQWQLATSDASLIANPLTGLMMPQRIDHVDVTVQTGLPVSKSSSWVQLNFSPQIDVPTDAWIDWDAAAGNFITVGSAYPGGLTALRKVEIYYPSDLYDITWHDGSPLSPADFIMPWIMLFDRGKLDSAIYDSSAVGNLEAFQQNFKGIRFVSTDPLVIEYYSDLWSWEAEMAIPETWPQYGVSEAPWHMIAISNLAESNNALAYSTDKADLLSVDWMDYVGGSSLSILDSYLSNAITTTYIPYGNVLGTYITNAQATDRYSKLQTWYQTHGHFWVGTGPYYLDQVSTTQKNLTLNNTPTYVDLSDRWADYNHYGTLSGYVYQSDGTTPIANMAVSLIAPYDSLDACTDSNGYFSFDHVPFDIEWRVSAVPAWRCAGQPEGYVHEYWQDTYAWDDATIIVLNTSATSYDAVIFTLDTGDTTSGVIGATGGTLTTPQDNVSLSLPPDAVTSEIEFTITDNGSGYQVVTNDGGIDTILSAIIGPEGITFSTPVTLIFSWEDNNNDAIVDSTSIPEENLYLSKDGVIIAGPCGTDIQCDLNTNQITVQVSGLSFFAMGSLDTINPYIQSIALADPSPTSASSVDFTVTFSEPVLGVNNSDFSIGATSVTGTAIVSIINPGDQTVYTVTVNTGSGNGTIRLDVVDDNSIMDTSGNPLGGVNEGDGDFTAGETYEIIKSAIKPSIPVLLSPTSGKLLDTLQPALDWKDSKYGPLYYQLQVSTNRTFTHLVLDETNLPISEFTFTTDLVPGMRYYWRIRTFNVPGQTKGWSDVWNFKTPLDKPILELPVCGTSLLTDRPDFDWGNVDGAVKYTLQISRHPTNFGTTYLLFSKTVTASELSMPKDLPQNKSLYWRVRAKTSVVNGPWSDVCSFTTGNPPSVPVLKSPANNTLVKTYLPTLKWYPSKLPSGTTFKRYELQVDDDSDFSSPVIDVSTTDGDITEVSYTPLVELTPNVKYFWRVRAVNLVGVDEHVSGWSKVWSFRTVILPPVLLSPADGSTEVTLKPLFDWEDVDGATSYTIQISTSANFSTFLVNTKRSVSNFTPGTNLPKNKVIYWRVRANGPNGPSAWSKLQFLTPP